VTIRLTYAVRYDTFALYSIEPGLKEKGEEMGLPARLPISDRARLFPRGRSRAARAKKSACRGEGLEKEEVKR